MEAKVAKEKERAEKERIMAEEKAAEEGKQEIILPKIIFFFKARIKEEMEEEKMRALNSLNAGQSFKQQGKTNRSES